MRYLHKGEWPVILRYLLYTALFFLIAGGIQLGLIIDEFKPQYVLMPILLSLVLGSLLGINAVLRRRLQVANRIKTDFLSRISHELRTPMTSIIGFSQYLRHQQDMQEKYRQQVERIYASSEHLLSLINDLLDLSQMETGEISLELTQVDVGELMQECVSLIEPLAEASAIVIENRLEGMQLPLLSLDRVRTRQVFVNLLSNAIKYNKPQGRVIIDAGKGRDAITFRVTDTGMGISDEFMSQVFDYFTRDAEVANQVQGTGIGLAITQHLVEKMHGHVGVESVLGEGSCFWVEFPLHTPAV